MKDKQIAELLQKRRVPWLKIIKMGGNLREILRQANIEGNGVLARKARNALDTYGEKR